MTDSLSTLLEDYARRRPAACTEVQRFAEFLKSAPTVFERTHPPGHFTASCWLVSCDRQRVLLTHHRKLGRWLQLGGHADGQQDLAEVALREAEEESGLRGLVVEPRIFDLDAHMIPARANEPEHLHWDVRFVVQCSASEAFELSAESLALAWVPIDQLLTAETETSLRRMAQYWRSADPWQEHGCK